MSLKAQYDSMLQDYVKSAYQHVTAQAQQVSKLHKRSADNEQKINLRELDRIIKMWRATDPRAEFVKDRLLCTDVRHGLQGLGATFHKEWDGMYLKF
jgi:hypothetical protein